MRYLLKNIMLSSLLATLVTGNAAFADSAKRLFSEGNKQGATGCASCHGSDGAGNADSAIPRLAGLHPEYLQKQLADFKSGKRHNITMNSIAKALDDKEITTLSQYLSKLKTSSPTAASNTAQDSLGEKIATLGNWDKEVPACFRCHGEQARGGGPAMPALAGQHASYIQAQLLAWKSGERANDPLQLMSLIAARLSREEISSVARYLAGINPQTDQ